ncbi:uncharacterized protein LOC120199801 [Hibiscus syriacus]|uniref:uncharacterized protein LOC120199801 n=1 Tax=Hibiscus syriacus TaxID=106335 RepID=UPI001921EAE9|nr:uncharacterized protein LOC120199801 [Hibiscus syriacus]
MDYVTASKSRLEFAKICVEIDVNDDIPKTLNVVLQDGLTTTVYVEVPWLPPKCKNCKIFGHNDKNCLVKSNSNPAPSQVWKKKYAQISNCSHEGANSLHASAISESFPNEDSQAKENQLDFIRSDPPKLPSQNLNLNPPSIVVTQENDVDTDHNFTNSKDLQYVPSVEIQSSSSDPIAIVEDGSSIKSSPKRGRGNPPKEKTVFVGSKNRFELLNSIEETTPNHDGPQRKSQIVSKGVDELVKDLKQKKKDKLDKTKSSSTGGDGTSLVISANGKFNGNPFVISAVYGSNDTITRRQLWLKLLDLESSIDHLPWILGGNFNITLHPNESSDFELLTPFSSPEMKEIQEVIRAIDLLDHPFFGPLFTWSNKQSGSFLARKLDRVLINHNWVSTFQSSFVEFLPPGVSDHCMTLVWFSKDNPTNKPKPFKFFNFWTLHPNFLKEVEQSWKVSFQGNPMKILFLKLKHLKTSLKKLNSSCYSDISSRREDSIDKELQIQQELNILEKAEHLFLKHKAKVKWIKDGDQCTKFFHSAVNVKKNRETIRMLIDDQGNRLESFDLMASEVIYFYSNLIGAADPSVKGTNPQFLKDLLNYSIPSDNASNIVKEVSNEEIKESIFG